MLIGGDLYMLTDKQLRNVKNAFKKASTKVKFYIKNVNEFGEEDGELFFTETNGILYEDTTKINLNIKDNGTTTTDTYLNLMILKCCETELIDEHLICSINSKRYKIVKINNVGEMDIYYELRLKRVD